MGESVALLFFNKTQKIFGLFKVKTEIADK